MTDVYSKITNQLRLFSDTDRNRIRIKIDTNLAITSRRWKRFTLRNSFTLITIHQALLPLNFFLIINSFHQKEFFFKFKLITISSLKEVFSPRNFKFHSWKNIFCLPGISVWHPLKPFRSALTRSNYSIFRYIISDT